MKHENNIYLSDRVKQLKQSGIRAATARCIALNGINLGQGVCDIATDENIKASASDAIYDNKNIYAPYEGVLALRQAVAKKIKHFNKVEVNPETEILISHGSTGAFVSAAKTLFNPGDEVILFEPFYGYHKHVLELVGVKTVSIKENPSDHSIDFQQLQKLCHAKTRGIVICTPCNPSGKVFTRAELIALGEFAEKNNLFIITDEIYEYITYPGYEHISLASLNNFWRRTITLSGFSKTYNVTGWRLGYAYGPAEIINKMALVHDLLYICPSTPLQHAMISALQLNEHYFVEMREKFLNKRDLVVNALRDLGFTMMVPQGAYYLMADFRALKFEDDQVAASFLLEQARVATVPGRSFYQNPEDGRFYLRFCYAIDDEKLKQAIKNLRAAFKENV
jgi:aminotransferase